MKLYTISPEFVESAPTELRDGVIYISARFSTALHKCCCGCGREVITPLNSAGWSYTRQGETVSFAPSIGNWSFPCKSHYLIIRNRVVWAGVMSERQIARVKARDARDKDEYIRACNQEKSITAHRQPTYERSSSWILKLLDGIRRWWSS